MIDVESNLPLPARDGRGAKSKYPFGSMAVGDSFEVPNGKRLSVYQCAAQWTSSRHLDWKFSVRKTAEGSYRCWRVA